MGQSTAITYEQTRVEGDPDIYMELSIAPGFYEDRPVGAQAGWTNIRTFVGIPSTVLNLANINSSLDLSTLSAYEVTPKAGGPAGSDILTSDTIWRTSVDSFFDVFLANIPPEESNPNFEALLVADVVMQENPGEPGEPPVPLGTFWNINPQSPEPATLFLLALGGAAVMLRKRKA